MVIRTIQSRRLSSISTLESISEEGARSSRVSLVELKTTTPTQSLPTTDVQPSTAAKNRSESSREKAMGNGEPRYDDLKPSQTLQRPPFWRRHLLWLITMVIIGGVLIGLLTTVISHNLTNIPHEITPNNTLHSVAASGLFVNDGKSWNMQLFWQNTTGGINIQMSLNGKTYEPAQKLSLKIEPKIGTPLSATAELDGTSGDIMLNLFYISGQNSISMSALSCPANSTDCSLVKSYLIPTIIPASSNSGLTAVNVNNDQAWHVYYQDETGAISQLSGNTTGFDGGQAIGGLGLNGSSIAAVNVNQATSNINIFYVDMLTQALVTMEFIDGSWTIPIPVSSERVTSWNPLSGLGSAYSPEQDQLHVYYTGLDLGIYEFLGSNASTNATSWAAQPGRNHIWAMADYIGADIAAVGWTNQVRFYQLAMGRMVQGALSNTTWTESFVGGTGMAAGLGRR